MTHTHSEYYYHATACTIATSLIHSKLDNYNSLLMNLPSTQTKSLQLVLMLLLLLSPKLLKFHHTSILKSLLWLKINKRIQYKFSLSHIRLFILVILHIFIIFLVLNAIILHARLL
jgi:hypothetical protein